MNGEHEPAGRLIDTHEGPAPRRPVNLPASTPEPPRDIPWWVHVITIVLGIYLAVVAVTNGVPSFVATIIIMGPVAWSARDCLTRATRRRHAAAIGELRSALTFGIATERECAVPLPTSPCGAGPTPLEEALAALDRGDQASAVRIAENIYRSDAYSRLRLLDPPAFERIEKSGRRLGKVRSRCAMWKCREPAYSGLPAPAAEALMPAGVPSPVQDRPHGADAGPTNGPELGVAAGSRAPIAATSPSPNPCDSTLTTARS